MPPNIFDQVLRFSFLSFSRGASFVNTFFVVGEDALVVRVRAGGCATLLKRVTWAGLVDCLTPGLGVFALGGNLEGCRLVYRKL